MRDPGVKPEQTAESAGLPPTCMLEDVRAAGASGSLEIGGTTTVTEGTPETYAPDRYVQVCLGCGSCGVTTQLRHPIGTWKRFHFPDGPEEMRRVNLQCTGQDSAS